MDTAKHAFLLFFYFKNYKYHIFSCKDGSKGDKRGTLVPSFPQDPLYIYEEK